MPRTRLLRRLPAAVALAPAMLVVLVVYLGGSLWSAWISTTASRILPSSNFVGMRQYESLFNNTRWEVSLQNLVLFGVLFVAISIVARLPARHPDRPAGARARTLFRALLLYPFSMSFIVTGPDLALGAQPDHGPAEAGPRPRLLDLHVRLDRAPGQGDLHAARGRHLARGRPRHGDRARRPARHRRGYLEGRPGSTASRPGGPTSRS